MAFERGGGGGDPHQVDWGVWTVTVKNENINFFGRRVGYGRNIK
jgi:hypothetical protein